MKKSWIEYKTFFCEWCGVEDKENIDTFMDKSLHFCSRRCDQMFHFIKNGLLDKLRLKKGDHAS